MEMDRNKPEGRTVYSSSTVENHTKIVRQSLLSWRALIAGFFISILTFTMLLSLGLAVGGYAANNAFESLQSVAVGSSVWTLVSIILAVFAGSYFAGRLGTYRTPRIGAAQGLVIASLFLVSFLYMSGQFTNMVATRAAQTVGFVGTQVSSAAGAAAQNPQIRAIVEEALGDEVMRGNQDPAVVAQQLGLYLVQGETEQARNYLARTTNISPEEAEQRLAALQTRLDEAMTQVQEGVSSAMVALGWFLFIALGLGALSGSLGGALGSRENKRHPLEAEELGFFGQRAPVNP